MMIAVRSSVLITVVWSGILMTMAQGDQVEKQFLSRVFTTDQGALPYRLLIPQNYDHDKDYPLVIFYHGAGERGSDNHKQLVHGMADFISDDVRSKYACFVVAPQCPEDSQWVETPWSADAHDMPKKPSDPLRLSLELVDSLKQEFSIDQRRIYITGLSMGGYAVWDVLQRHPRRFAAAVPICGGGDQALAERIAHVPLWAFHGANDQAVNPKRTRAMIDALQAAGGKPGYTEYPGVGHNSWEATYANRQLYAWLFSQRLPE
jgi:predicted peptidase